MERIKTFEDFALNERQLPDNQGKILVILGAPGSGKGTLSKELKNAGLTATSDVSKYIEFYNGLNPTKQKIMSKLLKQDDYFKSKLLKSLDGELPKIVSKGLKKMVEENPKLLQSIPFFERLWVRELGSNSIFITILTLINVFYGDVLNDRDVERLKGVYSLVPESLKKEMAFNLLANGDKIKEIINTESFKSIEKIANTKKVGDNWAKWYNTKLKDSVTQAGGTYIELSDDTSRAIQNINKGKKDENIFRKQGWIPMSELKDGQETYDFQLINSVDWVKVSQN
jgi:energy-coupling factor transporter ATP-binding protein EcfA2